MIFEKRNRKRAFVAKETMTVAAAAAAIDARRLAKCATQFEC